MVARAPIIDLSVDAAEARRDKRRRAARLAVVLLLVGLIIASLIGVAWHSYRTNRSDALELSQGLIEHLDRRLQNQVQTFLGAPGNAVELTAGLLESRSGPTVDPAFFETLAIEVLNREPAITSLFAGTPAGDFVMVQRAPSGGLDTKRVERSQGSLEVTWTRRDVDGQEIARERDPSDRFDPRTRPWFGGAVGTEGLFWSDLYIFFTSRELGITVASAVRGPDGNLEAVVGADISLAILSEFLGQLPIGQNGRAIILTARGEIVGLPRSIADERDMDEVVTIADLNEPLLAEAFDRIRVSGPGRSVMEIDGERYIVAASDLAGAAKDDWVLLIVVPEDDFTGFVATNTRRSLLLSGGTVFLALLLAGLLAWQTIRTERTREALRGRQAALDRQTSALEQIAALANTQDGAVAQRVTELGAGVVAARRVSVWQLEGPVLHCIDCFDRETGGHTSKAELREGECPGLFGALRRGEEIEIDDAAADPRTADAYTLYLQPVGCRSLLSVPVRRRQDLVGALWFEDPDTDRSTRTDSRSIARTLTQALGAHLNPTAQDAPATVETGATDRIAGEAVVAAGGGAGGASIEDLAGSPSALRTASIAGERNQAFLRQIPARGLSRDRMLATVFPTATVLVLKLLDDLAIAASAAEGHDVALIEQVVELFQRSAEKLKVRYVKILGDQIIAIEGLDGGAYEGAARLGDLALALHDELSHGLLGSGRALAFGIGLDTGTVLGAPVGFGRVSYNIWGETLRVGLAMAATAPTGAIQCTHATYEPLRQRYLFRRRGGFYLEPLGEMTTYTLRGRI